MKKEQIEKIKVLIEKISLQGLVEISPSLELENDLGLDSLDQVELIMELENEFSISIPDDLAVEVKTVKDVYDLLDKLIK